MAQVTGPTPAARLHDGGARIISAVEVKTIMVKYVDPDGKEQMAEIEIFGDADYGKQGRPEDRLLGIWLRKNMTQLQEELRLVPKEQAKQIIAMLEEKGIVREGKVASAANAAQLTLPDVSAVFEDLEHKEEKT